MKARYLFLLAIVSASLSIVGLRSNSQRTAELESHIISRDMAGADVQAELTQLRQFVFSHMNASVEFELAASYERAVAAARQAGVSGEAYAQAQTACGQEVGTSSVDQVACVQNYLASRVGNTDESASLPERSQFNHALVSPTWSPDLAGLGLLATLIFLGAGISVYIAALFRARQF